jgi:hypothetical protein
MAAPICFEITMPHISRRLVYEHGEKQADVLINLSNDGWFGWHDAGRTQHAQISRFRAIENRGPVVRSVNTGHSVLIDAHGRLVAGIGEGRYGDALRLSLGSRPVVFFRGEDNVPFARENWSGTISLWMRLDPDEDLRPGYSDPLFITDRAWDDRSLFVDFTAEDRPRHFRFAAFADREVWNPDGLGWDDVPVAQRPMVEVRSPPFRRDRWTHVVLTFESFNTGEANGAMRGYLDGEHVGSLTGRRQTYSWEPEQVIIVLGLDYNGLIDDLSFFDRALSHDEVRVLFGLENGVRTLFE